MNKYESLVVFDANLSEEELKGLVDKFKALIETSSGQIESVEEWGKRRLAYEINDLKEGYYVLMNFTSNSQLPRELERNYKITDGVIKYLVIRK